MNVLFQLPYGSKLYGTSTPASDTDYKAVYLPELNDLLLNKKLSVFKERFTAEGERLGPNAVMPANGVETEFVPLQTFVRDFVRGQTYAVETLYGVLNTELAEFPTKHKKRYLRMLTELRDQFANVDVYSMLGFATKQTFDYVHRGQRLAEAQKLLDKLQAHSRILGATGLEVRLDTPTSFYRDGDLVSTTVLDEVVRVTGLKTGTSQNNNKTMRTLELNGRSYLETTTLEHLEKQVQKLVDSYGHRVQAAADAGVDYKSMSHAVRVYQQALELLQTCDMKFPRPNAEQLLMVKQGKVDFEEVKALLLQLDEQTQAAQATSAFRARTEELEAQAELWLLEKLRELYHLT
jgi:hypothetical protein